MSVLDAVADVRKNTENYTKEQVYNQILIISEHQYCTATFLKSLVAN
jgi:hypothetical protein